MSATIENSRSGGTRPRDLILSRGPLKLYRYRGEGPRLTEADPVVLVPSIINRAYIFDLREGQSIAAHLLDAGLDVYLLDWGEPCRGDKNLGLEDYGLRLIKPVLRAVRKASGKPRAQLFGYCLGAAFALMAAAAPLPQISGVCALTAPFDLERPGSIGTLTDPGLARVEALTAAYPVVPGPLLWTAFQALDLFGPLHKLRGYFKRGDDREFARRFSAQERWLSDPIDMSGRALRDIVALYRENSFARGALRLCGQRIDPTAARAPALNLIAERDTIVPADASLALEAAWGGAVETHVFSGGHLGVAVGSRAPKQMWAVASEWLARPKEACRV